MPVITENDLNEAIAEMNGQRHPNAETCIKLASYYTIKDKLFPTEEVPIKYSYAAPPVTNNTIDYSGSSEFSYAVSGKDTSEVMRKLDEIMQGLFVVNPPLYKRIMRDLTE